MQIPRNKKLNLSTTNSFKSEAGKNAPTNNEVLSDTVNTITPHTLAFLVQLCALAPCLVACFMDFFVLSLSAMP